MGQIIKILRVFYVMAYKKLSYGTGTAVSDEILSLSKQNNLKTPAVGNDLQGYSGVIGSAAIHWPYTTLNDLVTMSLIARFTDITIFAECTVCDTLSLDHKTVEIISDTRFLIAYKTLTRYTCCTPWAIKNVPLLFFR